MLPRLTALQWLILLIFLFFYGFAVFAVTRDYYLRHPPQTQPAAQVPHQVPDAQASALGERMRQALDDDDSERQIDLSSTDTAALGDAADALFVARRFDDAIPVYRRVLELEPEDAETHNDLGLALHYVGQAPGCDPHLTARHGIGS
jgi:tetratricopeptide (TPR) repeat protein